MDENEQSKMMKENLHESLKNQYYDTQKTYDKVVLTLSGGALSFSLLFKEKMGLTSFPIYSWIFWMLSLVVLLFSMYFSTLSYRRALIKFNDDENPKYRGGIWDKIILVLNPLGGFLFILGLIFFFFSFLL